MVATLGSALAGTRTAFPCLCLGPWVALTSWMLAHRPFLFKMSFLSLSSSCVLLWSSGKSFQLFLHSVGFRDQTQKVGLGSEDACPLSHPAQPSSSSENPEYVLQEESLAVGD